MVHYISNSDCVEKVQKKTIDLMGKTTTLYLYTLRGIWRPSLVKYGACARIRNVHDFLWWTETAAGRQILFFLMNFKAVDRLRILLHRNVASIYAHTPARTNS